MSFFTSNILSSSSGPYIFSYSMRIYFYKIKPVSAPDGFVITPSFKPGFIRLFIFMFRSYVHILYTIGKGKTINFFLPLKEQRLIAVTTKDVKIVFTPKHSLYSLSFSSQFCLGTFSNNRREICPGIVNVIWACCNVVFIMLDKFTQHHFSK